jgi:hypothetical protein
MILSRLFVVLGAVACGALVFAGYTVASRQLRAVTAQVARLGRQIEAVPNLARQVPPATPTDAQLSSGWSRVDDAPRFPVPSRAWANGP